MIVIVGDDLIFEILEVAVFVFLKNRPENPTVTMIVRELGLLQAGI